VVCSGPCFLFSSLRMKRRGLRVVGGKFDRACVTARAAHSPVF